MNRALVINDGARGSVVRWLLDLGVEVYSKTPAQFVGLNRWGEPVDLLVVDLESQAQHLSSSVRSWDMLLAFQERNHTGIEPPVVVMTMFNDVGNRLLGNIHAVSAYVLKPVRRETFVSTVRRILKPKEVSTTW